MIGHLLLLVLSLISLSLAGSLTDIKHVVLFMQENRAFDHVIYLPLCLSCTDLLVLWHHGRRPWLLRS
jgi:predicted permease